MEYTEKEMQEYIARFKMIMNRGEIRSKLLYAFNENTPYQNYLLQIEAFKREAKERENKIKEKERIKQEKEKMAKEIAEEAAAQIAEELKKALNGK